MYLFNVREMVRVTDAVPKELRPLAGAVGFVLYHSDYEGDGPTAEVVLFGATVKAMRNCGAHGRIPTATEGGQLREIPHEFLERPENEATLH